VSTSPIKALLRYSALGLIACGVAAATYAVAGNKPARKAHPTRSVVKQAATTPSADAFARELVVLARDYAERSGEAARITRAHCVQASPGHYMCSYGLVRPRLSLECHLVQGLWSPDRASTITVTLAGQTRRCGSLREAIRSLQ
jgi:hypothetical protein